MDASRLRRLKRETQNDLTVTDGKRRHIVVSPTVTRRPKLDAMLGMTSMIAEHELERMRDKLYDTGLNGDDRRSFKEVCELVLKQTRLEMEVERHVEQRMASTDDKEIARTIENELHDRLHGHVSPQIASSVIHGVLNAIGLDPTTND